MKINHNQSAEIIYNDTHWNLLNDFRKRALQVTDTFAQNGFDSLTYGSIARGDIKKTSDIDIILQIKLSSYRVELILEEIEIPILSKKLIQATPNDIIKVHYELEGDICLTLLLTDFTSLPFEFYKFGGAINNSQLKSNIRVPGVDKRLVFIQPTETGHIESPLEDQLNEAPKILNVSRKMIEQRMRVLTRRDKIGRTGIFLKEDLDLSENVEEVLRNIANKNPLIRKRLNYK